MPKQILLILTAIIFGSFNGYSNGIIEKDSSKPKIISFKIKLKSSEKIAIKPSALKYNKHFAYSFTLDDGYRSAYLTAFPLLNGGKISASNKNGWKIDQGGDETTSKGLFYTDGLGNKLPFKLALAINGASLNNLPNRGHLSWEEVREMYNAGWDILNHSFHHATKHGTNYLTEVTDNTKSIKENLNFTMSHFVVPGGEGDEKYYLEYEKEALQNGNFSVASYYGKGPVYKVNEKVDLDKLISARTFVQSSKDTTSFKTMDNYLIKIDSIVKQKDPVWFNEFTHGTGNTNLWNLSTRFPDFKYYMIKLANKYGANGNDSIWMAPWQEVYEYIWLRDRIQVDFVQNNKEVNVTIQLPEIPKNFRNKSISLSVDTDSKFETESKTPDFTIQNDGSKKHKLIVIDLKN
ncbi:polysaccharide deacetylase family protein [Flavobacterium sp. DG2-3]|uniref:polysaccharide deacetylase family protein n=1 Tax=Flavobacterium sp. DG2-3 TaxID=3068317 RepID=UPI00273F16CF|nr:polysaccharide deacetylase family protein [Flavobacterium sp. DG2-3]MDP5201007.1 polysaccharide deacetylase family protein [Flavobacterium sp. DG2-3]